MSRFLVMLLLSGVAVLGAAQPYPAKPVKIIVPAQPGGRGSLNHLAMEQFRGAVGFDAVAAHYRGIGPAITDFLGGQTQMMFPGLAAALPHIRAKKMKPVAITGLRRHPLLPDVPTFEE